MMGEAPPSEEARGTVFWQLDLYKSIQRHYPKPKPYATEVAKRGEVEVARLFTARPSNCSTVKPTRTSRKMSWMTIPISSVSLTAELKDWLNSPRILGNSISKSKRE